MIICSECNAQNEEGAGFCDQCGGRLSKVAPTGSQYTPAPSLPAGFGVGNTGNTFCPSCRYPVVVGEAFCDHCGATLNSFPSVPAVPPSPPPSMPASVPSPAPMPPIAAATGRLMTADGQSFVLAGKTSYLVGREDAVSGIYPDIDTTASGGMDGGVGRRHAEITVQGMQWFLKDLNSVNGSWVNNQRLAANSLQLLHTGDQIRLGKWMAIFYF